MHRSALSSEAAAAARQSFGTARSGSVIELIEDTDDLLVRKWSPSESSSEGFLLQRKKQSEFFESQDRYSGVTTPRIRNGRDVGGRHFDMDFVSFLPVSEQMITWSPRAVTRFVERLSGFLNENALGESVTIETDGLKAKFDQIVGRVLHDGALSRCAVSMVERGRRSLPEKLVVPVGYEHGDLTFSNILASHDGDSLVLIDFTLSPIETPLQDVAKLLQELRYRWSWRNRDLNNQEMARLDANLRYVRSHVCRSFEDEFDEALFWITFLTIARILPYAQSSAELAWIIDALEKLDLERLGVTS